MLSFIAFVIALILVQLSLNAFSELTGKALFINYTDPFFWIFSILFILFSGILAGSYPAFFSFIVQAGYRIKGWVQKIQCSRKPAQRIGGIAVYVRYHSYHQYYQRQIQFALDRDTGYNKNNLIFTFAQGDVSEHYNLIKHDLINNGAVVSMTRCANPITKRWDGSDGYSWKSSSKEDEKIDFVTLGADADFTKTTGIKLMAGRHIDVYNYPTDSTALMVNESAVKMMHLKDPLGMIVKETGDGTQWHVVGVVKNFIMESPY